MLLGSFFFIILSSLWPLLAILLIVPTTFIDEFEQGWITGSGLNGCKFSDPIGSFDLWEGVGSFVSLLFLLNTEIRASGSIFDWMDHGFKEGRTILFELNDLFSLNLILWIFMQSYIFEDTNKSY